ncbi:pentapeptide repeat-containing protein [Ruegeria lacuscaerulensis]|uniref:pentapeptide repeat-containing protein n=1 Tax=Ruegeria lacuscaerulensis TaxID=55218 RepID=UPI0014812F61|nr:pentapeptide repeat-containing protein [Ruegeria lacuscaerulensis]
MGETLLSFSEVLIYGRVLTDIKLENKKKGGKGNNKHLSDQLEDEKVQGGNDLKAQFAKIYGFAYEGTYYDLPEPAIFLVHGDGDPVNGNPNEPPNNASRAPRDPSIGGVAAADYQVANDIMVWRYEKADQTMRMDVTTGQFEQVLLDIYFGFDSPAISGAKVSGAKVSGAKVSGAKVSGAKVSGAKVSGAKVRGGD